MASPWSDLTRPPLRTASLRASLLAPDGPLARLEVPAAVGSTNAELVARAGADPDGWPHLSALTTDDQSAGRGRLGRSWVAPPRSGLAVSLLLRPHAPVERWSWLPLLAGLAVVGVVRDVAGLDASLKWPNDVLVDGAKVCGVLAEVLPGGAGARGVVLGVGLNVTTTREELPVPTATSLVLEGAASTDRDTLLRALLRALATEVGRWDDAGGDAEASGLAARVREACSTLGRGVRVDLPDGSALTGTAEGIDAQGRLLVRAGSGSVDEADGGVDEDGGADGVDGSDGADGADGADEDDEVVAVAAGDVVHVR